MQQRVRRHAGTVDTSAEGLRDESLYPYDRLPFLWPSAETYFVAVLDLLEPPGDTIAFIIMEEWSSQLTSDTLNPCSIPIFLETLRQCIEVCLFSILRLNQPYVGPKAHRVHAFPQHGSPGHFIEEHCHRL